MSDKVKPSWRRPSGPVDVWRIIEGTESLPDGTKRPVQFSIQGVPEDRREEAIQHMLKYFVVDEPIAKSTNTANDPQILHDFTMVWNFCLDQGIVVAAYVLDSDGQISELAGINMLDVMTKETEKEVEQLCEEFESPVFRKIIQVLGELTKKADALEIFGVDKCIHAFGLSVAPKFRGQKLGLILLESRTDIGKKYGIPATSTFFTAYVSQALAARAGFKEEYSIEYAEILNDDGKPLFPNIETKILKIMMKRLY